MASSIVAWLRLRDVARFRRDAKFAEEGIRNLGRAGKDTSGPLDQLSASLSRLGGILPNAGTETGILGLKLGSLINVIIFGLPLVIGLGGALVAVAGSLAQAAVGAGVLAVALAGVALPLGALGLVAAQAFQGFSKISTAFQQWQVQVKAYGRNSTQAETALQRLNGVVGTFGKAGGPLLRAVIAWDKFKKAFSKANQGALVNVAKIFQTFLGVARKLTPTIAYMARVASGALLSSFKAIGNVLTSGHVTAILHRMADAFKRLSGPLTKVAINLIVGLLNVADKAAPALQWLANELVKASAAFRKWSTGSGVGVVIGQFKSWWNLMKAVGSLLITILGGGAKEGKGLVDSLTAIVNKWNRWLKSAEGQKSLKSFFHDSAQLARAFFAVLGPLIGLIFKFGRILIPIYTVVFRAIKTGAGQLLDALKPMQPFLSNILGPLLKGLAIGVLGAVVGAFKLLIFVIKIVATVLGFLGQKLSFLKPVFLVVGKILGFVFGGAILKVLGALGKLSFILKPVAFLFRVLRIPIVLAGKAVGFVAGAVGKLFGWFSRIAYKAVPFFRSAIDKVVGFLGSVGSRFVNAGKKIWDWIKSGIKQAVGSGLGFAGDLAKGVANAVINLLNAAIPNSIPVPAAPDIDIPNNPIPTLAKGGVVSGAGSWITGEAGPEINTLVNGQVRVLPLTPSVQAQGANTTLDAGAGRRTTHISKVYLRGRQIAEAVADEADDERVRRGKR